MAAYVVRLELGVPELDRVGLAGVLRALAEEIGDSAILLPRELSVDGVKVGEARVVHA